ncbi:MAG: diguanylate cyclase [Thermodesulfovibrionales bacterium]|jgi:two-component system cell cycle response regulator
MKKDIIVYGRDRGVQDFLKDFFKNRKDYSARFIQNRNILKKELGKKPDALLIDSPDGLEETEDLTITVPVIALISREVTKGIRSVIKSDVECYLLSPFLKDELESKLKVVTRGKSWLESLYMEGKNLHVIVELSYLFSSTLNPREVLFLVVKKLAEIIKANRCSILSINPDNRRYAEVISTFEDPDIVDLKIDLQKYPEIRKALTSKKTIIIKDAQKDPLMKDVWEIIAPIGIRSIVVIPVIFRDEVIGTLLLRTSRKRRSFTKREIDLCIALANASANALYNALLHEKLSREKTRLERFAITDYLTGIYNIRYFYNRIEEEFSRAVRYRLPLSCIMFDIDHFKKVNDNFGHRVGDIILREFAQLLKMHTRRSDVFARYGGEEFILLLPQTQVKGAIAEAERIRNAVKEHQFNAIRKKIDIAVSIGIACRPHKKIKNYDDLINLADNAMFDAKKKGRDRIVVSPSR